MAVFLLQLNILVIVSVCTVTISSVCEVRVPGQPWPTPSILVPINSTVLINCTTNQTRPYWSINLAVAGDVSKSFTDLGGQMELLHKNGLYQVHVPQENIEGEPSTLTLLINSTEFNNQTVVKCIAGNNILERTTLFVYERSLVMLEAMDTEGLQSSNISWGSLPSLVHPEPKQTYTLTVKSPSIPEQIFQLYEPYYLFTAPEGAPPCEVYNFSVTATYDVVGATYTGVDCSVPSPVFSRMLPSLPDISRLESSLQYSLQKELSGQITVIVTFMPANYCEMYPVTGYALEVEGPTSHSDITQSPSNDALAVNNLLNNQAYFFSVVVSNCAGNVSTGNRTIYTTDVQMIRALPQEDNKSFLLQCNFMAGSNAQGCMMVVIGEFENITGNITRDSKCTNHTAILNTTYPTSNYSAVFGYDIEYDGSIGELAIPGVIVRDPAPIPPCVPNEVKSHPSKNIPTWAIITIGVILGVALVSITVILVFVAAYRLVRRRSPTSSAGPAPVTPPPAPTRDFIDEGDDTKKPQPIYDQPEKITIPKEEHTYHVLETSAPRYQFKREDFCKPGNGLISPQVHDAQSPTHSESDSSPCDPPPVYQDIADIPLVRDRHRNGRAGASGQETSSSFTELNSSPSQPPVYQEITELPSSRASFGLHDSVP